MTEISNTYPATRQLTLPQAITDNLNPKMPLRPYQQEALRRFIAFFENNRNSLPAQMLFHKATGSGKTLIMAALILYLFSKGYRNFLFFVHNTNIIDKTRNNFLNPSSSKYLFSEHLQIEGRLMTIREVRNFSAVNPHAVNLIFSTIQGLHRRLNAPGENTLTYSDFTDEKTVLISDEAHHINAETKKGRNRNKTEQEAVTNWEQTVNRIFQAHSENLLLEFTATIDWSNPEIARKYKDKVIYDYPLKRFRKDGYSKDVKVLQADLPDFDRALQALVLSQYRLKLFEQYGIPIKPVVLFKSRNIKSSRAFYQEFRERLDKLHSGDLERISPTESGAEALQKAFNFFKQHHISLTALAEELRRDFSEEKCLMVNSQSESESKQISVNSLEEPTNLFRAVFAVDKLNEGWDVLNLFDIVRLYNTRDARKGKPGKTTVSEAQLIGRGARYCPFRISPEQPLYQRKFDHTANGVVHELKLCEELYYHSAFNPEYISELHTALEEIGMEEKQERVSLALKTAFRNSRLYREGVIFLNKLETTETPGLHRLPETLTAHRLRVNIATGYTSQSGAFDKPQHGSTGKQNVVVHFPALGEPIIRKALHKMDFFHFANLKKYLPALDSITEFIHSPAWLGSLELELSGRGSTLNSYTPDEKLQAALQVLEKTAVAMRNHYREKQGTLTFFPFLVNKVFFDKTLTLSREENEALSTYWQAQNSQEPLALEDKSWYPFVSHYGNSAEAQFLRQFSLIYPELQKWFSEIFLVHNTHFFRIYRFEDGKSIAPAFVLFLTPKNTAKTPHYQIFISPDANPSEETVGFFRRLNREYRIAQPQGKVYTCILRTVVVGQQEAGQNLVKLLLGTAVPCKD